MTPERLLEIRRHHVRGCPWCSDVPELLTYVDELTARLSEYEVADSTAKKWQAEIQWSEARAEAAEQDAFTLNAALTSAEVLLEEARGVLVEAESLWSANRAHWAPGFDRGEALLVNLRTLKTKLEKRGTK